MVAYHIALGVLGAIMAVGLVVAEFYRNTKARRLEKILRRFLDQRDAEIAKLKERIAELEEFEEEHEGCDGGQWAEDLAKDLTKQLRAAHDLMKRGDVKDARHELERAMEELATVPVSEAA